MEMQAVNVVSSANIFDMERLTDNVFVSKGTDPKTVVEGGIDSYNNFFPRQ